MKTFDELFDKADRMIRTFVQSGGADKKAPVIYPMGRYGMLVKHILNDRYGIQEEFVADNLLSEVARNNSVYPISKIKDIDMEGRTVLLSCEARLSAVRAELLKYTTMDHVLDVFSPAAYFDNDVYTEPFDFTQDTRSLCLDSVARELERNNVPGAVAECGVNEGGFATYISRYFPERTFYLFDTFEGFDPRDVSRPEEDLPDDFWQRWDYTKATPEKALRNIPYRTQTVVRQGYFPDTAKGLEDERFAFVNLDMDLYQPIKAGLEFFYPRMSPGGVIFVHDATNRYLTGVRKAIVEFCTAAHAGYIALPHYDCNSTAMITKPY